MIIVIIIIVIVIQINRMYKRMFMVFHFYIFINDINQVANWMSLSKNHSRVYKLNSIKILF